MNYQSVGTFENKIIKAWPAICKIDALRLKDVMVFSEEYDQVFIRQYYNRDSGRTFRVLHQFTWKRTN